MRTTTENNTLTIFLEGRIDMGNAAQTESEIFAAVEGKTADIVIDSEKLEYTYYGTTDKQKLELLGQRCGAFALMRMATTLGIDTKNMTPERASAIAAVLRERLFTNTDSFCKLFAMPL